MSVRVSVKLAPVSAVAFGLVSVNVMVEVPPAVIEDWLKAFAIVGVDRTISVSLAGPSLLP